MTQMIPPALSDELRQAPGKGGEVRVYDALASGLKGDWLVMYSLSYLGRHRTGQMLVDGEIDFLIGRPDLGFLVLEVKGGDPIEREGRSWYSYSKSYERHEIRDPFMQAMTSKNLILDALKEDPQLKGYLHGSFFCHAVCFPDTSELKGRLLFHEKEQLMIFSGDLDRIQQTIEDIFAFSRGSWISNAANTKNLMNGLKERYASHAMARRSGREIADRDGQQALKLTEQQYFILTFLENQDRVGIQGCPGSGKTLLALEKARRSVAEGRRTLMVCFNQPLGSHLLEKTGLREDLMTGTFHAVLLSILIKQLDIAPAEAMACFLNDDRLLETLMDHQLPEYDTIIVDEAQDFSATKLDILQLLLPERGQFYLFYDRGQNLIGNDFALPEGMPEFPLTTNHRNSRAVGRYLKQWAPAEFQLDGQVPDGLPVKVLKPYARGDVDQLLKGLGHAILELRNQGFDYRDIAVITLGSSSRSALREFYLQGVPLRRFGEGAEEEAGLTLDSVKRYKGLESPIVIITETEAAEPGSEEFKRKMASAVSRAVTQVLIQPTTDQLDFFLATVGGS